MKKRKGFTLMELIVAMLLFSIISVMISSIIRFSSKSYTDTDRRIKAFENNTNFAIKLSDSVKKASTAFTVPKNTFNNLEKLSKDWNYLGLRENVTIPPRSSRNGKELRNQKALVSITYIGSATEPVSSGAYNYETKDTYNLITNVDGQFEERIIGYEFELDGKTYTYDLEFEETGEGSEGNDNHVNYTFRELTYENGVLINTVDYGTSMTALNSIQVVYRGDAGNPATALAFRSDIKPMEETFTPGETTKTATIVFVLDVSGSMAYYKMYSGENLTNRFDELKACMNNYIQNNLPDKGVNIILVPFGSYAGEAFYERGDDPKWLFQLGKTATKQELTQYVNDIPTPNNSHCTGLGDGLRRAYYEIKNLGLQEDDPVSLVLITDGAMNTSSFHIDWGKYDNNITQRKNVLSTISYYRKNWWGNYNYVRMENKVKELDVYNVDCFYYMGGGMKPGDYRGESFPLYSVSERLDIDTGRELSNERIYKLYIDKIQPETATAIVGNAYYIGQNENFARQYTGIWANKIKAEIKNLDTHLVSLDAVADTVTKKNKPGAGMSDADKTLLTGVFGTEVLGAVSEGGLAATFDKIGKQISEEMISVYGGPKL